MINELEKGNESNKMPKRAHLRTPMDLSAEFHNIETSVCLIAQIKDGHFAINKKGE